jgi:hypothetical protein
MADNVDMHWYRSKVDWWIGILLCIPPVAAVVTNFSLLMGEKSDEWPAGAIVAVVVLGIYVGLVFPMRYGLGNGQVVIRSGLLRQKLAMSDIVEVHPTHNPLSSPALSLDRLRIQFGKGFFKGVMISPAERHQFLDELAQLAGLRRDGDRLFRP